MFNQSRQINEAKKKRGWKFWLFFWTVSFIFLGGWAIFLQYHFHGVNGLISFFRPFLGIIPTSEERKQEIQTIFAVIPEIIKDKQEKTFLILFQNDMEIRPGGGYIGSFGILKTKGEKVISIETHDTNVFDKNAESGVTTPVQIQKTLKITNWELRDSNWSGDFPTNARRADEFYHREGGVEKLDGVVAISTDVLNSFLEVTGPITVEGVPGEFNSENAVTKLEYQVEKGFLEQGLEKNDRKNVMKDMAKALINRAQHSSWSEKKLLLEKIEKHLNNKDIMIYFKDENLQKKIAEVGWAGEMKGVKSDYLMITDANLGALKTDQHIKRSFDYVIDFSQPRPVATLRVIYKHTARERDWMTTNYVSFLKVYVPAGSTLLEVKNFEQDDSEIGKEADKNYFGHFVTVPIGTEKAVRLVYELPQNVIVQDYDLLIQKQSGLKAIPGKVTIIQKDGSKKEFVFELNNQWQLAEQYLEN
jgi:hypothetical protein